MTGAVMDSPVMDFKAPVDLGARERNLPGFVTATVKWIATLRFGLDWDAMDYLKDADRLDSPILLIHGEDDTRVPIGTSDKLVEDALLVLATPTGATSPAPGTATCPIVKPRPAGRSVIP